MSKYDFSVVEEKAFRLWDYGWLDIIRCYVPDLSDDSYNPADFFASLLNHRIYGKGYGSGVTSKDTPPIHGPLLIHRLQPSDFVEISSFDQWIEHINVHYAEFDGPPDKSQIEAVEDYFNGLPKEGIRYFKLAVNHEDEAYHHELWYIHTIFHEYILVNPKQEMMWLMVMGYD